VFSRCLAGHGRGMGLGKKDLFLYSLTENRDASHPGELISARSLS